MLVTATRRASLPGPRMRFPARTCEPGKRSTGKTARTISATCTCEPERRRQCTNEPPRCMDEPRPARCGSWKNPPERRRSRTDANEPCRRTHEPDGRKDRRPQDEPERRCPQ
jgi:hypothetical protein